MITEELRKIIFRRLNKELSSLEIIEYNDGNLYFIDREKRYWYLDYNTNGRLYWRFQYFDDFFKVYSLDKDGFRWIIAEWVEEALNCKVQTAHNRKQIIPIVVEQVLIN